ncbi:choice-of-anchor G family protein [Curtobacterium caseinilyticum]|uniref:Choice-of-anchor G family protein n=1 Tax=Curtobacterium caseinilyticum TaxID=3055137 RepID=A0ABT7TTL1_9MICO|nr:choice-of-anchor G family protein [Curtobacterium caseinilyticum]MDM7892925.1 choice-of-anchor G family protein [Curtobacterium caseinilyticum]
MAVTTVVAAVVAVTVPVVTPSTASWQDHEWVHGDGAVGTSSFACGEDVDYTARSTSRFLGGTLAGQDLDGVASVRGLDVTKTGTQGSTVSPATAPEITRTETTAAYGNPLDVGALGDVLGLDLTGLGVGLPAGSAGAVNQVATSVATGRSVAASGLVSDSGGVLVTDTTPTEALPEPATLDLGQALPVLTGVSDVGLEVGAVGSSAQLEGCDLLEDEVWGTAAATGSGARTARPALLATTGTTAAAAAEGPSVTRGYGVAGLDLRIDSPLVSSLTTSVNGTLATLDRSVAALAGRDGLLSRAIQRNIAGSLTSGLGLGRVGGTVTLEGTSVTTALAPVLAQPLTDGTVTVDLTSGSVRVDLAHLLGDDVSGLNDLPPNTEIVLDAALVNAVTARLGALLDAWTQRVTGLVTTALDDLRLRVALDVDLDLLGIPLVQLNVRLDSGVRAVLDGRSSLTVGTTLLGASLGLLTGVVSALVTRLVAGLPAVVLATLRDELVPVAGSLGTTLARASAPVVNAAGAVLSRLPAVLSVRVNVQRDVPGSRDGRLARTGAYSVTAISIALAGPSGGTPLAAVDLASSTVGPNLVDLGRPGR